MYHSFHALSVAKQVQLPTAKVRVAVFEMLIVHLSRLVQVSSGVSESVRAALKHQIAAMCGILQLLPVAGVAGKVV